jgi:hypothetical protein
MSAHGFGMVFEHLRNSFDLEDSRSCFIQFHQLCFHVAFGCILWSMGRIIGASRFLILAKPFNGIRLVVVGKAFYHLMSKV